jgi:exo-beta-1,3-glucanase (GH17 family)
MPTIPFHNPGVTYNGLNSTENPTAAEVAADLATTKQHFGSARTYYPQYGGGVVDVGAVAKVANLNLLLGLFLFPGHDDWTDGDYQRFVKPAVARGNIEGVLVGNEDPDMIGYGIIPKYLKQAKSEPVE